MNLRISDYHAHSKFHSEDAKSTMEEMCIGAINNNVAEIAFTDHRDFFPNSKGFTFDDMEKYMESIKSCQKQFGDRLIVLSAVELGQPHFDLQFNKILLEKYPLDFVIASVHQPVDVDLYYMDYKDGKEKEIHAAYLKSLQIMVETAEFNSVGHIDLPRRYAANNDVIVYVEDQFEWYKKILKIVATRGKAIEINTSGLRQRLGNTMPQLPLLKEFKAAGGQYVTIGSDSHSSQFVGDGFEFGINLLKEAGFQHLTRFKEGKPILINL